MKTLSLGVYPEVFLGKAREKRLEARTLIADGVDPMARAKADRDARRAATEETFSAIAEELLAKSAKEGLAETTLSKKRWLIGIANEDLGKRPIREIGAAEILRPLQRVEAEGNYESARRLRAVIGQVFRYAIATARADNDPTFGLRGALITPKVTHRAAMTDAQAFAGLVRAWKSVRSTACPICRGEPSTNFAGVLIRWSPSPAQSPMPVNRTVSGVLGRFLS